jgi:hypothetical protein
MAGVVVQRRGGLTRGKAEEDDDEVIPREDCVAGRQRERKMHAQQDEPVGEEIRRRKPHQELVVQPPACNSPRQVYTFRHPTPTCLLQRILEVQQTGKHRPNLRHFHFVLTLSKIACFFGEGDAIRHARRHSQTLLIGLICKFHTKSRGCAVS